MRIPFTVDIKESWTFSKNIWLFGENYNVPDDSRMPLETIDVKISKSLLGFAFFKHIFIFSTFSLYVTVMKLEIVQI